MKAFKISLNGSNPRVFSCDRLRVCDRTRRRLVPKL
jgi:hypothetical protein